MKLMRFMVITALIAALIIIPAAGVLAEGENVPTAADDPAATDDPAALPDDEWNPGEAYGPSSNLAIDTRCSLCGICPVQPLGICLFVWIGAAVLIIAILVAGNIIKHKKQRSRE